MSIEKYRKRLPPELAEQLEKATTAREAFEAINKLYPHSRLEMEVYSAWLSKHESTEQKRARIERRVNEAMFNESLTKDLFMVAQKAKHDHESKVDERSPWRINTAAFTPGMDLIKVREQFEVADTTSDIEMVTGLLSVLPKAHVQYAKLLELKAHLDDFHGWLAKRAS